MKSFVGSLEGKYKECHTKMVKDLYNTQGISDEDIKYCVTIPRQYSHQESIITHQ